MGNILTAFSHDDELYTISMVLDSTKNEDVYNTILTTFTFIDQGEEKNINSDTSCSLDTAGWAIYTNPWYGYTIKYPTNWSYSETNLAASETSFGVLIRYVSFSSADEEYKFLLGVREADEETRIAGRTGVAAGDSIDGGTATIASGTTSVKHVVWNGMAHTTFYEENEIGGYDIVGDLGGMDAQSNYDLRDTDAFQIASTMLCTLELSE